LRDRICSNIGGRRADLPRRRGDRRGARRGVVAVWLSADDLAHVRDQEIGTMANHENSHGMGVFTKFTFETPFLESSSRCSRTAIAIDMPLPHAAAVA
jgi:hypothetical protein